MKKSKSVDIAMEMRLHIVRKYKNQTAAAKHYGVSQSMISAVVTGRQRPSQAMLEDAGFKSVEYSPAFVKA